MTRVLAISDEISPTLYGDRLRTIRPDVVISCGDLPFEYLEYVASTTNAPLAYVFGNHDPAPEQTHSPVLMLGAPLVGTPTGDAFGPGGCTNVDGRVADLKGLRLAGLGGSMRYSHGPHQYTETEMRRRSRRLLRRARLLRIRDGTGVDVLVTHSPPLGTGDGADRAHRGFEIFHRLIEALSPKLVLHGHIHLYGNKRVDLDVDGVPVLNAVGYRIIEVT